MASLVLAALAGLAGCLLGYRLGRRAAPLRATRDVHFGTRASLEAVDGWHFPCTVISVRVTERSEADERFSARLADMIRGMLLESDSVVVEDTRQLEALRVGDDQQD